MAVPALPKRSSSSFGPLREEEEEGGEEEGDDAEFHDASAHPPGPVWSLDEVVSEEAQWAASRLVYTGEGGSIALCLSAGGIRAAACGLGVMWRMASLGCLRSVGYLSTVSGGGYTGTSYCTHLLDEEELPPTEPAACDAWYRRVLARVTMRMQRNCGYVLTFGTPPCEVPSDGSSRLPRGSYDVLLFALVLAAVLVFPLLELAKVAVPAAVYVNLFHGEQLRQVFCVQALCSEFVYSAVMRVGQDELGLANSTRVGALDVGVQRERYVMMCSTFEDTADLQDLPEVFLLPWLYLTLPVGLAYLMMQRGRRLCFPMRHEPSGSVGSPRSSASALGGLQRRSSSLDEAAMRASAFEKPAPAGGWGVLVHHSVTKLLRALVVISIVLNLLVLCIFVMQQLDWRLWMWTDYGPDGHTYRGSWRPSLCACDRSVPRSGEHCSTDTFRPVSTWASHSRLAKLALDATYGIDLPTMCAEEGAGEIAAIAGTSRSTRYFLVGGGGLFVLALLFGAVSHGARPLGVLASCVFPALLLWLTASACQWKVYGPITGQTVSMLPADVGPYTFDTWCGVLFSLVTLHMVFVVFFKRIGSVVSTYYRVCLTRAFYPRGADKPLSALAGRLAVPTLISGCTLNEYMRPSDTERSSAFALTPSRMGCARTGYVRPPASWTLGQTMGISGAAIDGAVLTMKNSFLNRLYLRITSAYLGGWVPYDDHSLAAGSAAAGDVCAPAGSGGGGGRAEHAAGTSAADGGGGAAAAAAAAPSDSRPARRTGSGAQCAPTPLQRWGPSNADSWPGMLGLVLWLASFLLAGSFEVEGTCGAHAAALYSGLGLFCTLFSVCFFGYAGPARVLLCMPVLRSMTSIFKVHYDWRPPPYLRLSDGGLIDKLGLVECLRRRVRWIVVSDGSTDSRRPTLRDLRRAIVTARRELGCSFSVARDPIIDVEDELDAYRRRAVPFVHLRATYPAAAPLGAAGLSQRADSHARAPEVSDIFHIRLRLPHHDRTAVQPLIGEDEVAHNAPLDPASVDGRRRAELGGLCCEGCTTSSLGRVLTGRFPNFSTGNQFFTPTVFANICRLSFELADEPVRRLVELRERAAEAERLERRV